MPQTCKCCKSAQRKAIDAALATGESLRNIASRYGMSEAAVCRHKAHTSVSIVKAAERREERFGANLVDELLRINRKAWELLAKMEAEGDHRGSVVALREVRECIATQDEIVSRAVKIQAATDPGSITVTIHDLSAEPAIPGTPRSLTQ